jgi:hypothetical protein
MLYIKQSKAITLLLRAIVPAVLAMLLICPREVLALTPIQDHLVSPEQLDQQVQEAVQNRQQNIETISNLLRTPEAERAMEQARVDPVQVRGAVATLSDQELADLAARATDVQQRISAGVFGVGLITLLVIAIVVLIVVAVVR